jgi:hypothetical protein
LLPAAIGYANGQINMTCEDEEDSPRHISFAKEVVTGWGSFFPRQRTQRNALIDRDAVKEGRPLKKVWFVRGWMDPAGVKRKVGSI